ncbi:unnamed protein product [Lepeophtheirus salmonis]|uniref:(salmon louse) hypothetical protein n=1 Tax=Lepeophtheirus salmonis TaxID=72036 RepID=A0A7R8D9J8_LEPSM|nr:unnamed protein product [Lepeophtheirus salmonis]CAF3045925.1 unnamed protein product [Lepeophtheirus salmonis]
MSSITEAQEFASYFRQLYPCLSMYSLAATIGSVSGLSGIALPQIEKDLNLSKEESAWFASISQLGMISTCVVGGILGQHFGRRKKCTFLQFGRFLNGAAGGLTSGVVPVYISEISTNNYRTAFGAGVSAFYLLGTNFVFILGSLLEWRNVIGISIIFPIFGIITMMTIPDSPVWLITKDRKQEAREALLWLRGQHYSKVDEELKSIQSQYKEIIEKSRVNSEDLMSIKPLLIVMTLMVLQQFCGMSAITYYAIKILIIAKSSIDKYAATVILVRTLFFTSALFMAIGTSMLGLGIYLNDETETSTTDIVGVLPILWDFNCCSCVSHRTKSNSLVVYIRTISSGYKS